MFSMHPNAQARPPRAEDDPNIKTWDGQQLWQAFARLGAIRNEWLDYWNASGIDALVCPVAPFAQAVHGGVRCVMSSANLDGRTDS